MSFPWGVVVQEQTALVSPIRSQVLPERSTSSFSFVTDLSVCRAVPFTLFSHSSLPVAVQYFLPFLKYLITKMLPMVLTGPALVNGGSFFEMAETGSF